MAAISAKNEWTPETEGASEETTDSWQEAFGTTKEAKRILYNHGLLQKIKRLLSRGHKVMMADEDSNEMCEIRKIELFKDHFMGYRHFNDGPWHCLQSKSVDVDGEKFRLMDNTKQESIDLHIELIDLVAALNSMKQEPRGSVFIASSFRDGDDFFLVRSFVTDGTYLCVLAVHDGRCHPILPIEGWVYDMTHRRYVYGEGGMLENAAL